MVPSLSLDYPFMVVRGPDGAWHSYAIEINLRKGSTTHPFLTLQFLTQGNFDEKEGVFRAPNGCAPAHAGHAWREWAIWCGGRGELSPEILEPVSAPPNGGEGNCSQGKAMSTTHLS